MKIYEVRPTLMSRIRTFQSYKAPLAKALAMGFALCQTGALPAQSLDDFLTDSVEDTVTETVENTITDSVEDAITDAVESSVAESVEESVAQSVEDSVIDVVEDSSTETLAQNTGEVLGQVTNEAQEVLEQNLPELGLLAELPDILPIEDALGTVIFNDVAVENGWRAVQNEWLLMVDTESLAKLAALDVEILERTELPNLDMALVRFRVDDALDSYPELREVLLDTNTENLDRNHIYNYQPQSNPDDAQSGLVRTSPVCEDPVRVGVIDTLVDADHRVFAHTQIQQKNFLQPGIDPTLEHGTAVASLIVGNADDLHPTLPNASLAVASVVYQRENGSQGATVLSLLSALDWLVSEQVDVINMSIAGPPNGLLEQAIDTLNSKGLIVVAAVGNEGPAAPPVYPAAYEPVIGATAVDANRQVYRWANRGDLVDFSAPGVSVRTASLNNAVGPQTGTSMAVPVVASYAACMKYALNKSDTKITVAGLAKKSVDLGEPGKDSVFGFGYLE